ncbi:anti-sigma factor [Curtobacterium pusillum]|uniref:anti-sigma factor n=1 Tax=Curtobacterium pusillum TaxID=69373 RepID=UPI0011A2354A|nr:anti-sigma factor [Curtobacterium pusillum]
MRHVDDETLAMLAVSDEVADDEVARHLASCRQCRDEVAALQRVAAVTRSSADVGLVAPPERVWDGIAAEVAADRVPVAQPGGAAPDHAHVTPRRRSHRGRRLAVLVAAGIGVVAVVLGIGVATGVVPGLPRGGSESVLARADLAALPAWKGSSGTAELERARDGRLTLVVDLHGGDDEPGAGGLREVWMMRSDLKGLVSVGFLDGDRGRFTVPAAMDTSRFPVVDVSAEADDGDPAHSGDSIVRGTLGRP